VKFLLLIVSLHLPLILWASDPCATNEIVRLSLPVYPDKSKSPMFQYLYRRTMPSPGQPTVIFLPGGPGQTSITNGLDTLKKYNVIYTDPRGVGCNQNEFESWSDDFYDSRYLASDILSIIENEKLIDYVIYGQSYGTLLATIIASKIEQTHTIPRPQLLFLEGIMGRASQGDEWEIEYSKQWNNLKTRLPLDIQQKINADAWPIKLTPEGLGEGISGFLSLGKGMIDALLIGLFTTQNPTELEGIAKLFQHKPSEIPPSFLKLHRNISCREFSNSQSRPNEPRQLLHGQLIAGKKTYCDGIAYSRQFDAGKWPTTVPLYYFVGENDPNTPVWQAEYHFNHQPLSPKNLIVVQDGAGHAPLTVNLSMDGCGKKILDSVVLNKGDDFEDALQECKTPFYQKSSKGYSWNPGGNRS
jgi:pimeloyl-ACP methyl ester carboxylesterase